MLTLLLPATAAGACPATSAEVVVALDDAEVAFGSLQLEAFRAATAEATSEVGCLTETLPRPIIARLHRLEGLRAFVDEDAVGASAAFASARAIAPSYQFPDALVPPGHAVRERYTQQDPASGGEAPVPPPADGHIEVDGRVGALLPRTRPSVVQWVKGDGSVPASAYLRPGEPLFTYAVGEVVADLPAPVVRRARTSIPLAITSGVLLAAAGGSYALAAGARRDYVDTELLEELEPLRARTNRYFVGSVGIGGAGVAVGLGAVLVGKW